MKKELSFETGIGELEDILAKLSDESTPLEESVKLYAKAAELIAACNASLQNATLRIQQIDEKLASQPKNEEE